MSNKAKAILFALALITGAVIVNKASTAFQSFQQSQTAQYAGQ
jgi:hypothetical protein